MLASSASAGDIRFWTTEEQPDRLAKQQAMAEQFEKATGKEPLTYYDMNLSAQDHQTFFTCDADASDCKLKERESSF